MTSLKDILFLRGSHTFLRFRHLIIVSSVLIFAILSVGLYIVYKDANIMRQQINKEFNQQQLILARQAALQIVSTLNDIRIELERVNHYHPKPTTKAEFRTVLKSVLDILQAKGAVEIGVFDTNGVRLLQVTTLSDDTISFAAVQQLCQRYEPHPVLQVLHAKKRQHELSVVPALLAMSLTIEQPDDAYLYVVVDAVSLIGSITGEIQSGKTGYAWVIDESGYFLYHPRHNYIGQNAFDIRKQHIPTGDFSVINRLMREEMLKGQQGTSSYIGCSLGDSLQAVEKLIAFAPVRCVMLPGDRVWSVAVTVPVSEVAEAVHGATSRHIAAEAAIILCMFLLGLLIFFYERKIARTLRRRVAEKENYLSSVLQYSVDAIILIDNENRVLVWNKGAELIFGYTEKEMVGNTFHCLIPPEIDAEKELATISKQVLRDGFIRNHRVRRITKDGRRITVDLSRTLVRDENGEPIGSVAIIKDVTEEIEFEQRMYNTEKLASIGTLASGVAHEINNPLAIILGFTDLLKERFPEGSPEREDLKIIEENAENAKRTVENLLGFARVTEGDMERVDVQQCLETVIKIVERTLITENITLVKEIAEGLPYIRGVAREFQQVIFNLINNAIAAMKGTGGTLTISAWVESGRLCIRVTDTGVGIPDRIKRRVFDPFFTTKKVGEGTGLGLSLCYGIVKKYGGTIDFYSNAAEDDPSEPSGTSFTITMLIDSEDEQQDRSKK